MIIRNTEFDTDNKTYIMGILNVTPDSFSDGNRYMEQDTAIRHATQMISEGADIIDVGGESTRPGHTVISEEEEISRVIDVIKRLRKEFDIPISIDTYKYNVAKAALEAGADMINDIWGLKYDCRMAKLAADYKVPVCLMHNSHNRIENVDKNSMSIMIEELKESIAIAKEAGIADDKIIVDPGIGFAKSYEMNLHAINRLEELTRLGYPILLATSNKSVIGLALDEPVDKRLEGTLVTTVMGVIKGAAFVRVHDVIANKRAIVMAKAIINS